MLHATFALGHSCTYTGLRMRLSTLAPQPSILPNFSETTTALPDMRTHSIHHPGLTRRCLAVSCLTRCWHHAQQAACTHSAAAGSVRTLHVDKLPRHKVGGVQDGANRQQRVWRHPELGQLALDGHARPLKVPQLPAQADTQASPKLPQQHFSMCRSPSTVGLPVLHWHVPTRPNACAAGISAACIF